jgi:hypothetical protein
MRTRTTTLVASLLAAFAVAAGGSLAGPAASADAHYLRATDTFHFPAWSPRFRPLPLGSLPGLELPH